MNDIIKIHNEDSLKKALNGVIVDTIFKTKDKRENAIIINTQDGGRVIALEFETELEAQRAAHEMIETEYPLSMYIFKGNIEAVSNIFRDVPETVITSKQSLELIPQGFEQNIPHIIIFCVE
ncbi:MAG: hypothetical protein HQK91_14330 [Nitrospirae bacterium]|nr:hypothetical protein [Nitrospirota bacterium]MBF0542615.1 hypothetical protein [Nitrospirota bacterium]